MIAMTTSGNDTSWRMSSEMSSPAGKCVQENYMNYQMRDVSCVASNGVYQVEHK